MSRDGAWIWGSGLAGAALLALGVVSTPAAAEMLRCIGPDGKVIYTDKKALCPAAKPFEPKAEIQVEDAEAEHSPDPAAPASVHEDALAERMRRAQQREAASEAEQGEAERWKKKQAKLEADVEKLRQKREYLEKFITNCNRGGLVYARDDAGIKHSVKCTDVKAQYASLGAEEESAQAALEALPEECRRAGCLPGWLR